MAWDKYLEHLAEDEVEDDQFTAYRKMFLGIGGGLLFIAEELLRASIAEWRDCIGGM